LSIKQVRVGSLVFGGEEIHIQSMLNISPDDIDGNIRQAKALEQAGCAVIRAAVPTATDARLIAALKENLAAPIVADIHFDYRIAIEAAHAGADKLRLNPGNIGADHIKEVASLCLDKHIAIRAGVNGGSLEKTILAKHGAPTAEALAESAMNAAALLEQADFFDIVLSVKSSDVLTTIKTYRILSKISPYPLHVGVTEAGVGNAALIKSAVGIGSLLADGIGDTIRVSLTGDPIAEVYAAKDILTAVGRGDSPEVISCPTCGRTRINVAKLAERVQSALRHKRGRIVVAVMGCAVNGPGEASRADIGVAGGDHEWLLFKKGEIVGKIAEENAFDVLMKEIDNI
jgi:(E)-4-hydroxy-3-methylbut-2-enyl-diphosphate synthase